jgi:sulfonate dioxygenase
MASTTQTETTQFAAEKQKVVLAFDEKVHSQYKYAHYLPVYDEETKLAPIEQVEFVDRGIAADKAKPNLISKEDPSVVVTKLTPLVGTEISGLQLSELSDVQKDELALLIAERGVVVFRDQDFKAVGPQQQKEFGAYFGRLHIHVSSLLSSFMLILADESE